MQIAGTNIKAEIKQKNIEIIIRKANDWIMGNAENRSIAKPTITERAFMVMPLPVVIKLVVIASEYDFPIFNSDFILQKIWMV